MSHRDVMGGEQELEVTSLPPGPELSNGGNRTETLSPAPSGAILTITHYFGLNLFVSQLSLLSL